MPLNLTRPDYVLALVDAGNHIYEIMYIYLIVSAKWGERQRVFQECVNV